MKKFLGCSYNSKDKIIFKAYILAVDDGDAKSKFMKYLKENNISDDFFTIDGDYSGIMEAEFLEIK